MDASDLKFFEGYWISQFANLLNGRVDEVPPELPSATAQQVILTIKAKLVVQDDHRGA